MTSVTRATNNMKAEQTADADSQPADQQTKVHTAAILCGKVKNFRLIIQDQMFDIIISTIVKVTLHSHGIRETAEKEREKERETGETPFRDALASLFSSC